MEDITPTQTVASLGDGPCPIDEERWYDLKDSFDVCERHLNWIVTKCEHCGRYCFSSAEGMCPVCFDLKETEFDLVKAMEGA